MNWLFAFILLLVTPSEIPDFEYWYSARLIDLYDADTGTFEVSLGMGISIEERCRLARVDTWELRGSEREKGLIARDWLDSLLYDKELVIRTDRDRRGKYGRQIIELYYLEDGKGINVNDLLVQFGHGVYYNF